MTLASNLSPFDRVQMIVMPPRSHETDLGENVRERIVVPSPPLSFPTTVGWSPSDGPPPPALGDHTATVHAHLQSQKPQHKTKEFSIGCVQRAANVQRPTPGSV